MNSYLLLGVFRIQFIGLLKIQNAPLFFKSPTFDEFINFRRRIITDCFRGGFRKDFLVRQI